MVVTLFTDDRFIGSLSECFLTDFFQLAAGMSSEEGDPWIDPGDWRGATDHDPIADIFTLVGVVDRLLDGLHLDTAPDVPGAEFVEDVLGGNLLPGTDSGF